LAFAITLRSGGTVIEVTWTILRLHHQDLPIERIDCAKNPRLLALAENR